MKFKVILFLVICVLIDAFSIYFAQGFDAGAKTDLALAAVNGGYVEHTASQSYTVASNQIYLALALSNLVIGLLLFWSDIKSTISKLKENN
jgi:phosphate/sulfate permease